MSYGDKKPDKWSTCSDDDFKSWWRHEGHTCVKENPDYKGILNSFLCTT